MARRDRLVLLALALVALGFAMAHSLAGLNPDVLLAAPPLLMLAPLLLGRYVGERTIARLRGAIQRPRRRAPVATPPMPRSAIVPPRGGRLVAVALGRRGPPALLVP